MTGYRVYVYKNGVDFANIFFGDSEVSNEANAVSKALEYLINMNEKAPHADLIALAMSVYSIRPLLM